MNEIKKDLINKWIKQLSKKLKKPEEDILLEGLSPIDFSSTNVYVEYDDSSHSFYKGAFYLENEENVVIFTEHCGDYEIKKDNLNDIQEKENVFLDRLTRIKWIGAGEVYIEVGNERLYVNKIQLKSLQEELLWFIGYYSQDFSPKQLHLFKNLSGKDNLHDTQ